jgi:fructose-1,6-bisphosphatase
VHIQPGSLHQRVTLFIGSRKDVDKAEQFIREYRESRNQVFR